MTLTDRQPAGGPAPTIESDWPAPPLVAAPLSEADLREIEARTTAATPGPWEWIESQVNAHMRLRGPDPYQQPGALLDTIENRVLALRWADVRGTYLAGVGPTREDAAFMAHARADVPRLLAEVRRLRREVEELREGAKP